MKEAHKVSYSDAQLRSMRAMGLVPWVERGVGRQQTSVAPFWPQPDSPLLIFDASGTEVLGNSEAPLLILFEHTSDDSESAGYLDADVQQLVHLMVRAIGLTRGDIAQCVVESGKAHARDDLPCVSSLLTPERRAALWMQIDCPVAKGETEHRCPDGEGLGVPLWRIPHPAVLLRKPSRKSEAWAVMKAIAARLGTSQDSPGGECKVPTKRGNHRRSVAVNE